MNEFLQRLRQRKLVQWAIAPSPSCRLVGVLLLVQAAGTLLGE